MIPKSRKVETLQCNVPKAWPVHSTCSVLGHHHTLLEVHWNDEQSAAHHFDCGKMQTMMVQIQEHGIFHVWQLPKPKE